MNKAFSDWYDALPYGEPSYQEAFEAGEKAALSNVSMESVATLHADGYWTTPKTEAGRKLDQSRARVDVYDKYQLAAARQQGAEEGFKNGAKAFFDHLRFRAANNYHGRASVQEICDKENKLIYEWSEDALAMAMAKGKT